MIDLGWNLAWLAVQVSALMAPALALQSLARRKGPGSGAWVATLSLGLVAVLGTLALVPDFGPRAGASAREAILPAFRPVGPSKAEDRGAAEPRPAGRGLPFAGVRLAWDRFESRAAEPAARLRPWGRLLAVATLAGSGLGLVRLAVGLWAVGLCRRRGRLVLDPGMIGLVDELRARMGCRRGVEVREVPDLATPATAGWLRPMLLLPEDWPSWDVGERRAVVAHELAHVVRGDYATALVARVAVVFHCFHPMVRLMAGRLQLEQELAADALGARFAGGRSGYLLALSTLALRQDGRSRSWPARAFLPARGTLIRRIEMLRKETQSADDGRGRSRVGRLAMALGLVALTVGVASLKAPARAADEPAPVFRTEDKPSVVRGELPPFEVGYIPEGMAGVVAFRPSALAARPGMDRLSPLVREVLADDLASLARELQVDLAAPGLLKLECEDVESVVVGVRFGESVAWADSGPYKKGDRMHTILFSGLTVRTVAPFDWLAFFRQVKSVELEEAHEKGRAFFRIKGPLHQIMSPDACLYLPDDRTIVLDRERTIRAMLAREAPTAPAYLRGEDWARASRGIVAAALDNKGGALAKGYDLGRPDDAVVVGLFRGVERWVVGLDDSDAIATRAEVTTADPQAAEAVARSIRALATLGRTTLDAASPDVEGPGKAARLARGFLANLRVAAKGPTLAINVGGFGTFADLFAMFKDQVDAVKAEAAPKAAGAKPRAKKR